MERFFASKTWSLMLLVLLGVLVWESRMWQMPLLVEWNQYPSLVFWVEMMGGVASIGLILCFVAVILLAMMGRLD